MTTVNTQKPDLSPPPATQTNPLTWLQKNLFSTWYNSLITLTIFAVFFQFFKGFLTWATTQAKWTVIPANLSLFFVGRFPKDEYWRLWLILAVIIFLSGLTWGTLARNSPKLFSINSLIGLTVTGLVILTITGLIVVLLPISITYRLLLLAMVVFLVVTAWVGKQVAKKTPNLVNWLPLAWFLSFFIVLWLMTGGLILDNVSTNDWGGLLLTVYMAVVGIVLSLPFGILLALGRQSTLPVICWLCRLYIEIIRGVPLITILFMGQVMLPFFLPADWRPDRVLRAIVGLTMFSAAYLAENVRGGLQSIPRGQSEAAKALGLNTPLTLILIVLPQAIKSVIPAIVGQFIGLFQDTTLLAIVGLVELLGISRSILANPRYIGRYAEVYLFIGVIYWLICFAMSQGSKRLERQLNIERN
ncbi:amino acid ABC transporter permease [Oscillatoria salina]|uniref:amino acid ABC transporter permease n=1 Tax=Oscillatoria salina TaxID=331517 RepID=UPI0013BC4611|nr:amino acid ABC transporter permease [Oscillatoria salina]MBZ8182131.1 amino acid ABC transporter permease [Oscillatoria salina IIICB1]NET87785.1 amino acid ABC transporter permease [Kamptonema sp. SIO1D9]